MTNEPYFIVVRGQSWGTHIDGGVGADWQTRTRGELKEHYTGVLADLVQQSRELEAATDVGPDSRASQVKFLGARMTDVYELLAWADAAKAGDWTTGMAANAIDEPGVIFCCNTPEPAAI